jgi:hypothetical protein
MIALARCQKLVQLSIQLILHSLFFELSICLMTSWPPSVSSTTATSSTETYSKKFLASG